MSLGTGGRVSMATPWAGTTPVSSCQLAPSHWNRSVEKYSPEPPYLPWGWAHLKGREGWGLAVPLQNDLWRSAWICKDSLKQKINDPVWSARIHKDSQQEQQLIDKGSYKPGLVICSDQHTQAIRKHASKELPQRRGGANPLRPPRIITHALWGYLLTPQNTTRN